MWGRSQKFFYDTPEIHAKMSVGSVRIPLLESRKEHRKCSENVQFADTQQSHRICGAHLVTERQRSLLKWSKK